MTGRTRRDARMAALLALAAGSAACHTSFNYTDALAPRYTGIVTARGDVAAPESLRIVTFNVQYALHADLALTLLRQSPDLENADVIALQEMDERSVQFLADSLGMAYVYYPATRHPGTGRDFGNAILSRWPIVADRKIPLPYLARGARTMRAAVGATLAVGDRRVRVYSVHLATMIGNGPNQRREQLQAVLADADSFPQVVMAGDFNSETVPQLAARDGYAWPTRGLPHTNGFWTFDHILLRGVSLATPDAVGVVRDNGGASDHRPVWAVVSIGS